MRPGARITALALTAVLVMTAFAARADATSPDTAKPSSNQPAGTAEDAEKPAPKADDAKGGDDKPFDDVIKGMDEIKGLFTFHRRAEDNKLYLEIKPDQLDKAFLFSATVDRSAGERGFYASMMG